MSSPGGGGQLSTLDIVFTLKGEELVKDGIAAMQKALGGIKDVFGAVGQSGAAVGQAVTTGMNAAPVKSFGAAVQAVLAAMQQSLQALQATFGGVAPATQKAMAPDPIKSFGTALGGIPGQLQALQTGVQQLGAIATATFGFQMASAVEGYVRSGLAASAIGQTMNSLFSQMSMVIAGLFGPELQKITNYISDLVNWMRSLSDEQRENIVRWIEGGAAFLVTITVIPKVIGLVSSLTQGVLALGSAMGLATGVASAGIVPALGLIVGGLIALGAGSEVGRTGLLAIWDKVLPVFKQLQGAIAPLAEAFTPLYVAASTVFEVIVKTIAKVMPQIKAAFEVIGTALSNAFKQIAPIMIQMAELWGEIIEAISPAIPILASWWSAIITTLGLVLRAFMNVQLVIVSLVKTIVTALGPVLQWVADRFAWVAKAYAAMMGSTAAKLPTMEKPKVTGGRTELTRAVGGFEGIEAAWSRLARASVMATSGAGKSKQDRHIEISEQQLEEEKKIRKAIENNKPALR